MKVFYLRRINFWEPSQARNCLTLDPVGHRNLPIVQARLLFSDSQGPLLDLGLPDPEFYEESLPESTKLVFHALRFSGLKGAVTVETTQGSRLFCAENDGKLPREVPLAIRPGRLQRFDQELFIKSMERRLV